MKRNCLYCQNEFEVTRRDKHYCNDSCRQQAYILRKATNLLETSKQPIVNPSSETSENIILKNDVLKQDEKITPPEKATDKTYTPIGGNFIAQVIDLMERRNYAYLLSVLEHDNPAIAKSIAWINVRLRCLVECLLKFSESKAILLDDLIEITNAFTLIIRSSHYKLLPENYPYNNRVKELRNKLKSNCIDAEGLEELPVRLSKALKIELIVMRCELRTVAEKKAFNQLEFKDNKTQTPCETNHHQKQQPELKQWQINFKNLKSKQ